MAKEVTKRKGRINNDKSHLIEMRSHIMRDLLKKGISQTDIALIFNVHPSQVTRSLKKA